jgi:hypothetical protein
VEDAEAAHVRWVITRYNEFFSDRTLLRVYAPKLWRYLHSHFEIMFTQPNDGVVILRRRAAPLPERATANVLDACDVREHDPVREMIRQHLLFDTLYLYPPEYPDPAEPFVETRCAVRIPEGGELVLGVGYRRPEAVFELGAELSADLWVQSMSGADHVLHETFLLLPREEWLTRRWRERRINLNRFAGETVTLVFRAAMRGAVDMHPLSHRALALEWRGPQIESPLQTTKRGFGGHSG